MNSNKSVLFLFLFASFIVFGSFIVVFIPKGEVILFINDHHHIVMDRLFRYITYLGDGIMYLILFLLFLFVKFTHAIKVFVLAIVQTSIVTVFKQYLFDSLPRPKTYFDGQVSLNFVEGVVVYGYDTFPSGHTATAFALAALLALTFNKRLYLSFLLFISASLVAFSRVYLMQHFFIDVYIGAIIGVLCGLITVKILELFEQQSGTNKFNGSLVNNFKSK